MLTETQKAQIRLYLGYPDHFRYKNTRLESVLESLSPQAEVLITNSLEKLALVESSLLDAGTTGAGVKRIDEIWFENGWRRTEEVRKLGRLHVSRISIITGVPLYSDVFGTLGYLGDTFSGPSGGDFRGGGGTYGLG